MNVLQDFNLTYYSINKKLLKENTGIIMKVKVYYSVKPFINFLLDKCIV